MTFVEFEEAFEDVTSGNVKTPKSDYLVSGDFPIIDQGIEQIAGFTDDPTKLVKSPGPHIIFGDHTRSIKYMEHSFGIGAQGVRLLKARPGFHPRYLYHFLHWADIPNAGYSRHYKFLKELRAPHPPLAEQQRIAAILDQAASLVAVNRQQAEVHNSLPMAMTSRLLAEAPALNHAQLGQFVTSAQIGLDRRAADRGRELPYAYVTMDAISKDGTFLADRLTAVDATTSEREKFSLRHGDFIINTRNSRELVGKSTVYSGDGALFNNNILRLRFNPAHLTPHFVNLYLHTSAGRKSLESIKSGTTSVFAAYARDIYKLPIPMLSMDRQRYLIAIIQRLDSQRSRLTDRSNELSELFAALQARAFRGEL